MVIVKLQGGLGNQLFQYAIGRHIALMNKDELKLDISFYEEQVERKYCLGYYNINQNFANECEIKKLKREFSYSFFGKMKKKIYKFFVKHESYIKEKQLFDFDESVVKLSGDLYLEGYWQNEKYIKDIKDILKKEFTLKNKSNEANINMSEQINKCNSVCLHIRRGDYVSNKHTNDYHGTCSLDYYYNAADIIANSIEQPNFFVFSDDLPWVKENLKLKYPMIFVDINDDDTNYEDLKLMSLCKHNIIANSSFSWWGAWLGNNNDKMVVAPKRWLNIDADTKGIIPSEWIRI